MPSRVLVRGKQRPGRPQLLRITRRGGSLLFWKSRPNGRRRGVVLAVLLALFFVFAAVDPGSAILSSRENFICALKFAVSTEDIQVQVTLNVF